MDHRDLKTLRTLSYRLNFVLVVDHPELRDSTYPSVPAGRRIPSTPGSASTSLASRSSRSSF